MLRTKTSSGGNYYIYYSIFVLSNTALKLPKMFPFAYSESGTLRRSGGKSVQVLTADDPNDSDRMAITEIADELAAVYSGEEDHRNPDFFDNDMMAAQDFTESRELFLGPPAPASVEIRKRSSKTFGAKKIRKSSNGAMSAPSQYQEDRAYSVSAADATTHRR